MLLAIVVVVALWLLAATVVLGATRKPSETADLVLGRSTGSVVHGNFGSAGVDHEQLAA